MWTTERVRAPGPPNEWPNTTTGSFSCKIDVGGVVTVLDDGTNGQFGQWTSERPKTITSPTNVVWTCRNTVAHGGTPFDLSAGFWVGQSTPPIQLDSVAL